MDMEAENIDDVDEESSYFLGHSVKKVRHNLYVSNFVDFVKDLKAMPAAANTATVNIPPVLIDFYDGTTKEVRHNIQIGFANKPIMQVNMGQYVKVLHLYIHLRSHSPSAVDARASISGLTNKVEKLNTWHQIPANNMKVISEVWVPMEEVPEHLDINGGLALTADIEYQCLKVDDFVSMDNNNSKTTTTTSTSIITTDNSNNSQESDFNIICGESKFPCHRSILASHSEVFKEMFEEEDLKAIQVDDFSPEIVEKLVSYLYGKRVLIVGANAVDLFKLADKFGVGSLRDKCEAVLSRNVNVDNAADLLIMANVAKASKLESVAMGFVSKNLVRVKKTEGWEEVKRSHPDLLEALLMYHN